MIPKLSKKRLAQLDGKKIYSTITASRKAPRKRNPKRRTSEFKRCYGSDERVAFVKASPCAACGVVGFSQNAHVAGESGVGYKADAEFIAPLCGDRWEWVTIQTHQMKIGCHRMYDERPDLFRERFPRFDSVEAARTCELAYQEFLKGESR